MPLDRLLFASAKELNHIPAADMIQGTYDAPAVSATKELLVILSTERSGSTLLCENLAALDYCYAHEYFQPRQYMQILNNRWQFVIGGRIHWDRFVESLKINRTAPSGVLGINLHGSHLDLFMQAEHLFSDLPVRYVYVSRQNIIDQALSLVEARQTKKWSSHFGSVAEPRYNYRLVAEAVFSIQLQNARIIAFLAERGVKAHHLTYESFTENPIGDLEAIAQLPREVIESVLGSERKIQLNRQSDRQKRDELIKLFSREFLKAT